tara:strand:+ start:4955 stop:5503 length:549 start_codon:yes stop_codon:yes gene_type:complete
MAERYTTQDNLLRTKLEHFFKKDNNLQKMLEIVTGNSQISLRIVDWFATNYSKKYYTLIGEYPNRFKVYNDYKLKLKSYSKRRFDPFCRWTRIEVPYDENNCIETTIGQLNFFKWAIENKIIEYIKDNYKDIEKDMNSRNTSVSNRKDPNPETKTRKKRKELSSPASNSIQKECVKIVVTFK